VGNVVDMSSPPNQLTYCMYLVIYLPLPFCLLVSYGLSLVFPFSPLQVILYPSFVSFFLIFSFLQLSWFALLSFLLPFKLSLLTPPHPSLVVSAGPRVGGPNSLVDGRQILLTAWAYQSFGPQSAVSKR